MMQFIVITLIYLTLTSLLFMQECPPIDTVPIIPAQNMWNIPLENQWDKIEVMTWNIKDFPISGNTIDYVNEIITDILPDIISFQEINCLVVHTSQCRKAEEKEEKGDQEKGEGQNPVDFLVGFKVIF